MPRRIALSIVALAVEIYERSVAQLRLAVARIGDARAARRTVLAKDMWKVGDLVFGLQAELSLLGLQLDGVYAHLTRDLGVKRKWLEKAVIFRRYLPNAEMIPESLNWGKCEKGTGKVATLLKQAWDAHDGC